MKKIRINVLKKNQIIVSVIALMLVAAGYLNYSSNLSKEVSAKQDSESFEYAGIGDAKLVDSDTVDEPDIGDAISTENNQDVGAGLASAQENESIETNATEEENNNDYFTTSRLERDKMYSQMLETYQKILENTNIPEDQKAISSQEVANINNTKSAIMIAENLIKTKGFEDVVIFVNDKSVSIVVKADKLEQNQIAQIQNIISRELNTEISNIHISNK